MTHRIHGAAIYGNMDPINIPQMLAYIAYMDPMGDGFLMVDETVRYHLDRVAGSRMVEIG